MDKKLFNRIKDLSNVLKEDKPRLEILSKTKDSFGRNFVRFLVKFPNGDVYEEEYSASPFILDKFYQKLKYAPLKAFQYIKKHGKKEESEKK